MSIPHGDHRCENIVPGLLLHHHRVREHAAIPTDVLDGASKSAIFTVEPITGVVLDGEFAVGIDRQTMMAGFIVSAGAFDGGIVLRDVEINRPRA